MCVRHLYHLYHAPHRDFQPTFLPPQRRWRPTQWSSREPRRSEYRQSGTKQYGHRAAIFYTGGMHRCAALLLPTYDMRREALAHAAAQCHAVRHLRCHGPNCDVRHPVRYEDRYTSLAPCSY